MKLKIFEQNQHLKNCSPPEVMATDITTLNGIVKGEPAYKKGRKTSAGYFLDKQKTKLAIQKTFSDEIDENGFLKGLNVFIKWFDIYENPVLTKSVFVSFSISESAEMIAKRRKHVISYLRESGIRLGVKQYIDALFSHYSAYETSGVIKNLINSFIENGSAELQQAVTDEDNQEIVRILNQVLPNGETIKDAFLYQIT